MILSRALTALLQNAALLLAMVLVYDLATSRFRLRDSRGWQILFGVISGIIGIGIMQARYQFTSGIQFDTRSVLLAICGLFFGTVPTVIAMVMTACFRLMQGGTAAWPGIAVILASGTIGLAWRKLRTGPFEDMGLGELYGLGLLVHCVMLTILSALLPHDAVKSMLLDIGLPVILIYPVATASLGKLLLNRLRAEGAASALAESEERYRSLFEKNNAIMLILDPADGTIVDANSSACEFYGWPRDQLLQMRITQINTMPPCEADALMKKVCESGSGHFEFSHRLANGKIRDVEVFSGPIIIRGRRQCLYSIIHDIAERKHAEIALRDAHERLRCFVDANIVGIVIAKPSGDIPEANDYYLRMIGYTREEFERGMVDWRAITPPEWLEADERALRELRDHGVCRPYEKEYHRRDGTRVSVLLSDAMLPGPEEQIAAFALDITDRKKAENDLRETARRLKRAQEIARLGNWTCDISGNMTLSDELYEIHGLPKWFVPTSESYMSLVHPDDREVLREWIDDCSRGKQVSDCIVRVVVGDQVRYISGRGELIRDRNGLPAFISGTAQDITERRMLEEEIRESAERLQKAQNLAQLGSWSWPMSGDILWSDELYAIYGVSRSTFVPTVESLINLIHPDDRQCMAEWIHSCAAGENPDELVFRTVRPNGETRYVCGRGEISRNPDGVPVLMSGTAQDITERRLAELEAKHLNNCLGHLIEAIAELSSAHTLEDVQRTVCKSAKGLCGSDGSFMILSASSSHLNEEVSESAWDGDHFPESESVTARVLQNGEPAVIPDMATDNGSGRETEYSSVARSLVVVPVNSEKPIAAIGSYWKNKHCPSSMDVQLLQTLADATSRAVENVRLLGDLEKRVIERTSQLEAANSELEAFAYSVSHDLRAPLRAVDGYTGILLEEYEPKLDEEGKRICAVISESSRTMGRLIDDLLAFSRVGRTSMQPSEIDMATMAHSIFHELASADDRKKIDFRVAPVPNVFGDPTLARQVWANLISNAIKFSSHEERPVIEIGSLCHNGEVQYFIRDNGAGFDMRYIDKLFGVFQRLHSTKEFEGTGVGLAIVQRIVHRHGGRVWAESEPNNGATFHFTFENGGAECNV